MATVIPHCRSKFGRSNFSIKGCYLWNLSDIKLTPDANLLQQRLSVQTRASQLIVLLITKVYWCMCIGVLVFCDVYFIVFLYL